MLFVNQTFLEVPVKIRDFAITKSYPIALKITIENQEFWEFRREFRDSIEILQQSVDQWPVLTVEWSNIKLHSCYLFGGHREISVTFTVVRKKILYLTSAFGVYLITPAARALDLGNQKPESEQAKPKTALDSRSEKTTRFLPKNRTPNAKKKGKLETVRDKKKPPKNGQKRKSQRPPAREIPLS